MSFAVLRHPVVVVSSVALALLLSGCGGSSSPKASGAAAPSKAASAPAGGSSTAFCAEVKSQAAALRGTELAGLLTGGTPAAWTAYFQATAAMNQKLVDLAPAEVKPSVLVLQASTLDLQSAMAAAGYDPAKMGSGKLLESLRAPGRLKAATDLATYVLTNCAVDLTKA